MILYKYLKKQFANELINEGKILVGTYYDFRKMEDPQRGDKDEGRIVYSLKVEQDIEVKNLPTTVKGNLNIEGGGKLILKAGAKASSHGEIDDAYMFCCSRIHDQKLMTDFEADACIEIIDVDNFSLTIAKKLHEMGLIYDLIIEKDCNYIGHEVPHDYKETPHFLKDKNLYGHQAEYRFVFQPILKDDEGKIIKGIINTESNGMQTFGVPVTGNFTRPEIKPVFIYCNDISKFCKLI
jgi:hypothetical protein